MVLPSEIPPNPSLGDRTRRVPVQLREEAAIPGLLGGTRRARGDFDNTLLFLSNIEEIQWRIDGGREGRLLRIHIQFDTKPGLILRCVASGT